MPMGCCQLINLPFRKYCGIISPKPMSPPCLQCNCMSYLIKISNVACWSESISYRCFQTKFGKIYWTLTVLFMLSLGLYWCIESYQSWKSNPVLTTLTSTGLPIEQVGSWKWNGSGLVFSRVMVLGLVPAAFKLFSNEPATLKFVWDQHTQKEMEDKNNLRHTSLV